MNKIIIIFISIFFLNYATSNAEVVKNFEVTGNKRVSEQTIKVYGEVEIGKNYSEADLNQVLQNIYSTNFFSDVKINLKNETLFIDVKEYPVVNQLILIGEESNRYKEEIKKLIKLKQKKSFIKSFLVNDVEIIKQLYSSLGYNDAKVEIKTKKNDEYNLDLVIEIDKGNLTRISSINFIGDKKIKDKRLREIIASEEDKFWKIISNNSKFSENLIQLDKRLLSNYYKSLGYYNVKINSSSAEKSKEGDINLVYSIDAGKRYTITKITTNADSIFDNQIFLSLKKSYNKYIGEYYSPFSIKDLLEDIDILIENNNLQFVEHNVEEILNDTNNSIEVIFNIFESQKILVERISIIGNNVTNEDVIRGELILDEGDPFSKLNLDKSVAKLKARNIFSSVKSKVSDGSSKNLKNIEIQVEEKPTGEISAGAGVGTNGGSFAIGITENNWLGQGKRLNFEIEADAESLSGTLGYTNPNYDLLGNEVNYSVSSTSNDKPDQGYENSIISAGVSTTFEQYKDLFATIGLFASYDDLRTDGTASASLKKQSGEFSEMTAKYGFKYDKRNRAFMPTRGSVYSFNQQIPLYADKNYFSNTFSASGYKSFSENVVAASKFYISNIRGLGDDDVRLSKRKFLSNSRLRGFDRGKVGPTDGTDHIGGNYAAAVNFEASLPNLLPETTNTDFGLFIDFANVWGVDYDSTLDDSNKIRSSTGAAINWISPIGPMSFILSTNLSKAKTDETQSFTFNLGTTF